MQEVVTTPDGVDLAVTVRGAPDAPVNVVLLHGWCLSSEIYHHTERILADYPVRVISYDMRGHGGSGKAPRNSTTIAQAAEDLRTVLDTVATTAPVVLVGHSLGGMTIMALAEQDPSRLSTTGSPTQNCVGVVFVNTAAGDLGEVTVGLPKRLGELVRRTLPREFDRRHQAQLRRGDGPVRRRLPDALLARYILFGKRVDRADVEIGRRLIATAHPGVLEGYYHDLLRHDRHRALAHLADVPVRILAGGRDRLTPVAYSRRMADALPHATLSVVPNAGHMIPLESPDELAAEILRLARRVTAQDVARKGGR